MSAADVFISYASKDRKIADAICRALEAGGVRCWMAPRNIAEGETWPGQIVMAISAARVFLLLLSPHANESPHVLVETAYALDYRLRRLSVRLANFALHPDMGYFLKTVQWLDWAGLPDWEEALPEIVRQVGHLLPPGSERQKGKRVGGYVILQREEDGLLHKLWEGSNGVTYLALEAQTGRKVALKVLRPDLMRSESARTRLLRDAHAATPLCHRHIAKVLPPQADEQIGFYASEFVSGESVFQWQQREPSHKLEPRDVAEIAIQVCGAMEAADAAGLAHGALKPAKFILVRPPADGIDIKVIGYGFPADISEESDDFATVGISFNEKFASPEQLSGAPADFLSDVYVLGITLWLLLTGQLPFSGSLVKLVLDNRDASPPFAKLPTLPPSFRQLLAALLEKDRARRPQNPANLRALIEAAFASCESRAVVRAAPLAPVVSEPATAQFSRPVEEVDEHLFRTLFGNSIGPWPEQAASDDTRIQTLGVSSMEVSLAELNAALEAHCCHLTLNAAGDAVELGRGGAAVIYRGEHETFGAIVIKLMRAAVLAAPGQRERFLAAARTRRAQQHPNLAEILEVIEVRNAVALLMPFVVGDTLLEYIRRHGPLSPSLALNIAGQVVSGLAELANRGQMHRDVKPSNIMFARRLGEAGGPLVQLIDLDLPLIVAAEESAALAQPETAARRPATDFVGTPVYASPELIMGHPLDARADMYSLGITLWHLVTGQPLFSGKGSSLIAEHLSAEPPLAKRPDLPAAFRELVGRLVAKDRADRPADYVELKRLLVATESQLEQTDSTAGLPSDPTAHPIPQEEPTRRLAPLEFSAWIAPGANVRGDFHLEIWASAPNGDRIISRLAAEAGNSLCIGRQTGVRVPEGVAVDLRCHREGASAELARASLRIDPLPANACLVIRRPPTLWKDWFGVLAFRGGRPPGELARIEIGVDGKLLGTLYLRLPR